jgi:hypothetical protein
VREDRFGAAVRCEHAVPHPTLVALIGLAVTVLAVYTAGRRPSRRRALSSVAAAGLLLAFDSTLLCRCHAPVPWAEWAVLAACFALVLSAVGRPWLRRALAFGLVAASVVVFVH